MSGGRRNIFSAVAEHSSANKALTRGRAADVRAATTETLNSAKSRPDQKPVAARLTQETAMNRSHLARILPAVALALVLPASGGTPSDQAKENGTTTLSDQANQSTSRSDASTPMQSDSGKAQVKGAKKKAHGPTAIMDRATPTEKSTNDASAKHPPTVRMDQSTPDQKSPAPTSSGNDAQASASK